MTNTELLERIIQDSGLKKTHIAKTIGIAPETLARKIKNLAPFIASEIQVLCRLLNITEPAMIVAVFFASE